MQAPKPQVDWNLVAQNDRAGNLLTQQTQQNVSVDNANLMKMFGQSNLPQGSGLAQSPVVGGAPALSNAFQTFAGFLGRK